MKCTPLRRGANNMKSGLLDVNGLEICAGNRIKVTITPASGGGDIVSFYRVRFCNAAFRCVNEDGRVGACIGDFSYNCALEIV